MRKRPARKPRCASVRCIACSICCVEKPQPALQRQVGDDERSGARPPVTRGPQRDRGSRRRPARVVGRGARRRRDPDGAVREAASARGVPPSGTRAVTALRAGSTRTTSPAQRVGDPHHALTERDVGRAGADVDRAHDEPASGLDRARACRPWRVTQPRRLRRASDATDEAPIRARSSIAVAAGPAGRSSRPAQRPDALSAGGDRARPEAAHHARDRVRARVDAHDRPRPRRSPRRPRAPAASRPSGAGDERALAARAARSARAPCGCPGSIRATGGGARGAGCERATRPALPTQIAPCPTATSVGSRPSRTSSSRAAIRETVCSSASTIHVALLAGGDRRRRRAECPPLADRPVRASTSATDPRPSRQAPAVRLRRPARQTGDRDDGEHGGREPPRHRAGRARRGAGAGGRAAGAGGGGSSSGACRRIRSCSSRRALPGSSPRSSASTRRPSSKRLQRLRLPPDR
jgi:hypothetical protein